MKTGMPLMVRRFTPRSRRTVAHLTALCVLLLPLTFLLASCAAKTDRGPTITITDFRAKNVERLHDGIPSLVGDDSAGLAARVYIKSFESDLEMRFPIEGAKAEPVDVVPMPPPPQDDLALRYYPPFDHTGHTKIRELAAPSTDPEVLELKRWLDGRKVEAIGELRRRNEAFSARGDVVSAKMGLAAGYVAISCANEPGDVETITKLVEPLLTELNTK